MHVQNINESLLLTALKKESVHRKTNTIPKTNELKIAYLLASSFNRSKRELIGSTAVQSLTPLWAAFIDSVVDADDR